MRNRLAVAFGILVVAAVAAAQTGVATPGTVERIKIHGRSLEGNLEGDAPDRDVMVYLPAGYGRDSGRR